MLPAGLPRVFTCTGDWRSFVGKAQWDMDMQLALKGTLGSGLRAPRQSALTGVLFEEVTSTLLKISLCKKEIIMVA